MEGPSASPSEMQVLSPELIGVKAGGAALEGRSGWDMEINIETCGFGGPCAVQWPLMTPLP